MSSTSTAPDCNGLESRECNRKIISHNARILIVDDEPNVRLVFRTALESSGYTITTADFSASGMTASGGVLKYRRRFPAVPRSRSAASSASLR